MKNILLFIVLCVCVAANATGPDNSKLLSTISTAESLYNQYGKETSVGHRTMAAAINAAKAYANDKYFGAPTLDTVRQQLEVAITLYKYANSKQHPFNMNEVITNRSFSSKNGKVNYDGWRLDTKGMKGAESTITRDSEKENFHYSVSATIIDSTKLYQSIPLMWGTYRFSAKMRVTEQDDVTDQHLFAESWGRGLSHGQWQNRNWIQMVSTDTIKQASADWQNMETVYSLTHNYDMISEQVKIESVLSSGDFVTSVFKGLSHSTDIGARSKGDGSSSAGKFDFKELSIDVIGNDYTTSNYAHTFITHAMRMYLPSVYNKRFTAAVNAQLKSLHDKNEEYAITGKKEYTATQEELQQLQDELSESFWNSLTMSGAYERLGKLIDIVSETFGNITNHDIKCYNKLLNALEEAVDTYLHALTPAELINAYEPLLLAYDEYVNNPTTIVKVGESLDFTHKIVNPSFEFATTEGWDFDTTIPDAGAVTDCPAGNLPNKNGLYFFSSLPYDTETRNSLSQTITGLRSGIYSISSVVDCMSNKVNMFANGNSVYYKTQNLGDGTNCAITNVMVGNDGILTFGSESYDYYLLADNFKLQYNGTVASAKMSVTNAHYATFIAPFDVELPDDVYAYSINGVSGTTLNCQEISSTIPANTPVLIYSSKIFEKTFTGVPVIRTDGYDYGWLTGVYSTTLVPAGKYSLQNQNGKVMFYIVNQYNEPSIAANRAYLSVDASDAKEYYELELPEPSGIYNTYVRTNQDNGTIYNLNGQQVNRSYRGISILNGKKYLKK